MTEPNNQLLSNFVDFLQTMNQNNQQERAYVEELDQTKVIHDGESESDDDASDASLEEEIPDFFHMMEAKEFEKEELVPKSILHQFIFKQILKEENYEKRSRLLLYCSFYKTEKDSFLVNLFESIQPLFEEIYLKVCWKFYKLLTSSVEFENLVIEKILESGNYKLFAHHFTYHTKTDIELSDSDYEYLSDDKEKDKLEYKDLLHSIFNEVYM